MSDPDAFIPYEEHLRRVREVLDSAEGEVLLHAALGDEAPGVDDLRGWLDGLRTVLEEAEREAQ